MQAEFNLKREQSHHLICNTARNPRCPLHFHSNIELYLILSGEVEVFINDRRRILHAGELSVALSYDAHSYYGITEANAEYLIIPTDLCTEFLSELHNKQFSSPFIDQKATFEKIYACCQAIRDCKNELTKRGYVYVILGTLLEYMKPAERQESMPLGLSAELLLHIGEHYKEDISLTSVSSAFGYNPSYLSRAFKSNFKIGLTQYITMMRLREAVLLMKDGQKSITECAYESGFRSLRTFYRCFYNEFGCAPQSYRLQGKQIQS